MEAGLRPVQIISEAVKETMIEGANSAALISNMQLDLVEAMREIEIAVQ